MVLRAIGIFKDYHSMRVIKELANNNTLKFSHVSPTEVMKQKDLLGSKKSSVPNTSTGILQLRRNCSNLLLPI